MDSGDGYGKIEDYLENILDDSEGQGVLLLDEIQRFRTIDDTGTELRSEKYQDVWMLLSDGTFQSNSRIKQELIGMVLDSAYYDERHDDEDEAELEGTEKSTNSPTNEKKDKKKKKKNYFYKIGTWEASRLKKILKLSEPLESIMSLSKEDKLKLIKDKLNSKSTYEGKKYSKLLIIISGNLDEAFKMAGNVSDSDNDADVYHEFSKTIDIIKIKKALKKRFKPEQIARFGNVHLIYPIPNRAAYTNIIKQKCGNIIKTIKDKHNINIFLSNSVYNVIYNNGVFPTQGVRPLISTISSILENSLPKFLFEHLNQINKKNILIESNGKCLFSKIGNKTIEVPIPTVLDDIKNNITINSKTKTAVHEAGHAVLYSILFKTTPTQIVSSVTNNNTTGFIGTHTNLGSKEDILNEVKALFGGRIAEEIVFGENYITAGASSDYNKATLEISNFVRLYGMGDFKGVFSTTKNNEGQQLADINITDTHIENILEKLYKEAKELLEQHRDFLIEVSDKLIENEKLELLYFQKIAKKYIGNIKIVNPKDDLEINFNEKFKHFKNQLTKINKLKKEQLELTK